MRVYLGLDWKCVTHEKILTGTLGGTERKFLLLADHLHAAGHEICYDQDPGTEKYDLAIHANARYPDVLAKKHIVWAGSWHTDAKIAGYDMAVFNTNYMKDRMDMPDARVIHAPYQEFIKEYRVESGIAGRIFCHSNPNRYFNHALAICDALTAMGVQFQWHYSGGNRLYSPMFPECFDSKAHKSMFYWGALPRIGMLRALSFGHVWAYPNLDDDSETQCVAMIEAAVLGLPVILPDREPFREVMGSKAFYARGVHEFVELIVELLKQTGRNFEEMEEYREENVFKQWDNLILEVCS